jgi:hypothetical protein
VLRGLAASGCYATALSFYFFFFLAVFLYPFGAGQVVAQVLVPKVDWSVILQHKDLLLDVVAKGGGVGHAECGKDTHIGFIGQSHEHLIRDGNGTRKPSEEQTIPRTSAKLFSRLYDFGCNSGWNGRDAEVLSDDMENWNSTEGQHREFGRADIDVMELDLVREPVRPLTLSDNKPSALSANVSVHASFGGFGGILSNLIGLLYSSPLEERGDEQRYGECADYNGSNGGPLLGGTTPKPFAWRPIEVVLGLFAVLVALGLPIAIGTILYGVWVIYSDAIRAIAKGISAYRKK